MLKVFHSFPFSASRRRQCFDYLLPLDFRLLFWLQEKEKQKGSTRISEVSRNIYPLYSHGPSFHNASVKTVVREWVDSGPFYGRGFAEPLPSSNELGRFPAVKTAVPVDGRFEHIVLSCNEHQTTPSFGSNEKLSELSTFASAANVGEREENGDTREAEDGETRISSKSPSNNMTVEQDFEALDQFPVRMRVISVDDDQTCLCILETLLHRCHYHVTTTEKAQTALELLKDNKNKFNLVISDIDMPHMDGFKLLELLGLEMDLPIILLSAHSHPKYVMEGVKRSACDYLLRSVRIEELKNIWQHMVRKSMFKKMKNILTNGESQGNSDQNGLKANRKT
ncbi:unnamed protein product [Brassica oleracea var. botrytis]|uniref:BnaC08g10460D protein n=3 Tax=Brassica TaxID=3705 RepID=A0A078IGB2_BRANA|nr:BnaC08g10460D [Brassica napus]